MHDKPAITPFDEALATAEKWATEFAPDGPRRATEMENCFGELAAAVATIAREAKSYETVRSNEGLNPPVYVLEKMLFMCLFNHALRTMREEGLYHEDGALRAVAGLAGFMDLQLKLQPEDFRQAAKEFLNPLLYALKQQLVFAVTEHARDQTHAAILLDPTSGEGGIQ